MSPTTWERVPGPGDKYRTDSMREATTDEMSSVNGWPTTDNMTSDATSWSAVATP